MKHPLAHWYSLGVGGIGIGLLIVASWGVDWGAHILPLLLFTALSLIIKRLGFHVFEDMGRATASDPRRPLADTTHWLGGMIDLAALLVYGSAVGAWVAALSSFLYLLFRRPWGAWRAPQRRETALFNAGLKALMGLTSGTIYGALGGLHPPLTFNLPLALALGALYASWFSLDHLGWAVRIWLSGGRAAVEQFLRRILWASLLAELAPLPISWLIAAVYRALDPALFVLLILTLIGISFVVQRLVETQARQRARVAELSLINELSREIQQAQMDVSVLCELAYTYAGRIVDTSNFVLELVDAQSRAIHRIIWVVEGQRRPAQVVDDAAILAWMQRNPDPVLAHDRARQPLPFPPFCGEHIRCGLYFPLLATGDLVGLMAVECRQTQSFTSDHQRALTSVASVLATAIENAWLYDRARQRALQLETISEVSRQVAAIMDLEELFQQVVDRIQASFGYDHVQVFTTAADGSDVVFRASTNRQSAAWREAGYRLRVGQEGIIGWVAAQQQPALVNDVSKEPRYLVARHGALDRTRAELAVPLMVEDRVLGVLDVQSNHADAFTGDDLFVLQTLADQVAVAIEGAWLHEQALERERLQRELEVARGIQASLLPEGPPQIAGWEIAAHWQPALTVAGDFYDFIPLTEGRWGVLIADVSDKGVPAALFMALARTLIRTMAIDKGAPGRALARASDLIVADARADMFVTVFYLVLQPDCDVVAYSNAGHLPPLFYCHATGEVRSLARGGIALGAVPEIRLPQYELTFATDDVIVLFTDGITEALNAAGAEFGEERLARLVADHARKPAADLVHLIAQALTEFVGGQPAYDDQALVVVKRTGSSS